jgi:hypothetical protein
MTIPAEGEPFFSFVSCRYKRQAHISIEEANLKDHAYRAVEVMSLGRRFKEDFAVTDNAKS